MARTAKIAALLENGHGIAPNAVRPPLPILPAVTPSMGWVTPRRMG
jgi:hypothetical protein